MLVQRVEKTYVWPKDWVGKTVKAAIWSVDNDVTVAFDDGTWGCIAEAYSSWHGGASPIDPDKYIFTETLSDLVELGVLDADEFNRAVAADAAEAQRIKDERERAKYLRLRGKFGGE